VTGLFCGDKALAHIAKLMGAMSERSISKLDVLSQTLSKLLSAAGSHICTTFVNQYAEALYGLLSSPALCAEASTVTICINSDCHISLDVSTYELKLALLVSAHHVHFRALEATPHKTHTVIITSVIHI
jgi:hypothetical protein